MEARIECLHVYSLAFRQLLSSGFGVGGRVQSQFCPITNNQVTRSENIRITRIPTYLFCITIICIHSFSHPLHLTYFLPTINMPFYYFSKLQQSGDILNTFFFSYIPLNIILV